MQYLNNLNILNYSKITNKIFLHYNDIGICNYDFLFNNESDICIRIII